MRKIAGFVFDAYDDVDGRVLRAAVPSPSSLPDFVKTAARLSEDQIDRLPDDGFALVMLDEGRKMKKYATIDAGNTALSVIYLLKQAHLLPPTAVKIAASNLIDACLQHGLEVPQQLKIAATGGVSPVSGKSQKPYVEGAKVSAIMFPGREPEKESTSNPQLGKADAANDDVKDRTNMGGVPGTNIMNGVLFPTKEKEKTASGEAAALEQMSDLERRSKKNQTVIEGLQKKKTEVRGGLKAVKDQLSRLGKVTPRRAAIGGLAGASIAGGAYLLGRKSKEKTANVGNPGNIMETSPTGNLMQSSPTGNVRMSGYGGTLKKSPFDKSASVTMKQKSWRQAPYVDVSGWDPAAAQAFENKPAELTLLEGDFAVDGYDQVKTASVYFEENWRSFDPRKRHEYCVGLVDRMEKLGMAIPEDVARYGSTSYAADVDSYVEARRSYVHDEYKPALDTLLEKRAQVSPGTFAEALAEFDTLSGLRWHWDARVADPWYSTFGPSLEKLAEDDWVYDEGGARCDLQQLKELALNGQAELTKQFGEDFAKEFSKKPKEVFSSMPTPNKKVLARMASGVGDSL